MDDIDEEISFLDEKIKSSRTQAKERQKTNTGDCERFWYWNFSTKRTGRKGEYRYGGAKPKVKLNVEMENPLKTRSAPNANCMKLKQIPVRILKHHEMLLKTSQYGKARRVEGRHT